MIGVMRPTDSLSRLVIWQRNPSIHQSGALRGLVGLWEGPVTIVYQNRLPRKRLELGWIQPFVSESAELYFLEDLNDPEKWIRSLVECEPNAVHLTNALRGSTIHSVLYPLLAERRLKWALICEKPYFHGLFGQPKRLYYKLLVQKWKESIDLIFCMGEHAHRWFLSLGFPEARLVDFEYQLDPKVYNRSSGPKQKVIGEELRFIYAGQFTKRKGLDLLLHAIERLPQKGWTFDFYGNGGELEGRVLRACEKNARLRYRGVKSIAEIPDVISTYDVCVIPSRFDGWGMVVNEALASGTAVIVTSAAGASRLVLESGGGAVVSASVEGIANAMLRVIAEPSVAQAWSNSSAKFSQEMLIAAERMGTRLFNELSLI